MANDTGRPRERAGEQALDNLSSNYSSASLDAALNKSWRTSDARFQQQMDKFGQLMPSMMQKLMSGMSSPRSLARATGVDRGAIQDYAAGRSYAASISTVVAGSGTGGGRPQQSQDISAILSSIDKTTKWGVGVQTGTMADATGHVQPKILFDLLAATQQGAQASKRSVANPSGAQQYIINHPAVATTVAVATGGGGGATAAMGGGAGGHGGGGGSGGGAVNPSPSSPPAGSHPSFMDSLKAGLAIRTGITVGKALVNAPMIGAELQRWMLGLDNQKQAGETQQAAQAITGGGSSGNMRRFMATLSPTNSSLGMSGSIASRGLAVTEQQRADWGMGPTQAVENLQKFGLATVRRKGESDEDLSARQIDGTALSLQKLKMETPFLPEEQSIGMARQTQALGLGGPGDSKFLDQFTLRMRDSRSQGLDNTRMADNISSVLDLMGKSGIVIDTKSIDDMTSKLQQSGLPGGRTLDMLPGMQQGAEKFAAGVGTEGIPTGMISSLITQEGLDDPAKLESYLASKKVGGKDINGNDATALSVAQSSPGGRNLLENAKVGIKENANVYGGRALADLVPPQILLQDALIAQQRRTGLLGKDEDPYGPRARLQREAMSSGMGLGRDTTLREATGLDNITPKSPGETKDQAEATAKSEIPEYSKLLAKMDVVTLNASKMYIDGKDILGSTGPGNPGASGTPAAVNRSTVGAYGVSAATPGTVGATGFQAKGGDGLIHSGLSAVGLASPAATSAQIGASNMLSDSAYPKDANFSASPQGTGGSPPTGPTQAPTTPSPEGAPQAPGQKTSEADLMNFYMSPKGGSKSHNEAAALVAVATRESSLNPKATGDSGLAKGLYQWHPDRQKAIEAHFGKKISDMSAIEQAEAKSWEISKDGPEAAAGAKVSEAAKTSASAAARADTYYDERPRDKEGESQVRGAAAERLAASTASAPTAPTADSAPPGPTADSAPPTPTVDSTQKPPMKYMTRGDDGKMREQTPEERQFNQGLDDELIRSHAPEIKEMNEHSKILRDRHLKSGNFSHGEYVAGSGEPDDSGITPDRTEGPSKYTPQQKAAFAKFNASMGGDSSSDDSPNATMAPTASTNGPSVTSSRQLMSGSDFDAPSPVSFGPPSGTSGGSSSGGGSTDQSNGGIDTSGINDQLGSLSKSLASFHNNVKQADKTMLTRQNKAPVMVEGN